jgi:hypothetical protein
MPAQAGIQGREGMDTGFRRYDGSQPDPNCSEIFARDTKDTKVSEKYCSELPALGVLRGEKSQSIN